MQEERIADSRVEAATSGLTFYLGIPCCNCKRTIRYTSNGCCVGCTRKRAKVSSARIRKTLKKAKARR